LESKTEMPLEIRIEAEITEMDTMGFDDTDIIQESTDMQYKLDAQYLIDPISVESVPLLPIFEGVRPKKVNLCTICPAALKNG
jgi:hypothetical protein